METLKSFPWNKSAEPVFDLASLEHSLKRSHWGLQEAKQHITEHLLLESITGKKQSVAICFSGPPGTGKTTIAMAIANATGRPYKVVSFNGIQDAQEIKGHRKTYVGATLGRITKALADCRVNNPVLVLDEIDKCIGTSTFSVANTLLDILDPGLQGAFYDNYLAVPVDLRKVMFICTANDPEILPGPLRDRMHNIQFRAYTETERITIARYYIWPAILSSSGLLDQGYEVQVEDGVIDNLARDYLSVRQIKLMLESLLRKALFSSYVSNSKHVLVPRPPDVPKTQRGIGYK